MTQPNERPAIEAAKAHYAQVEQQGFAQQQQQQQQQPAAQILLRDLIAMLRQQGRGEPALGRAAAYQYAIECGQPPASGYAGSGELGVYTVSSYNELYTFCQQVGVQLPPLQQPAPAPQATPAPAPVQTSQWAPAPHPDPYPHLPAILPPDAPAPGQYAAYAQQHPEPVAPPAPAPVQYQMPDQNVTSQAPAAPMPAAMQATPGKRGRPSKKQEAAAAPAPAPVTTLTVAQPAFTAAAAAAQPPMTMTMPIQSVPVMTAQPASVDARSMQVSYPLATSTQVPNSGPVVAKPNGLHLYVDCVPEHVATQSLSAYLNDAATAIAKRYNVVDIRVADSDPLKYGWRGVYAAVLQSSPPPNGHYVLDTRGNEFAMQAATALLPLCASFVRGR